MLDVVWEHVMENVMEFKWCMDCWMGRWMGCWMGCQKAHPLQPRSNVKNVKYAKDKYQSVIFVNMFVKYVKTQPVSKTMSSTVKTWYVINVMMAIVTDFAYVNFVKKSNVLEYVLGSCYLCLNRTTNPLNRLLTVRESKSGVAEWHTTSATQKSPCFFLSSYYIFSFMLNFKKIKANWQ